MHLKVFVKIKKKNPKNPLVWVKNPPPKKTKKKTKKPKKKPKKTQKNPLGWVFLKKPGFFPTLQRAPTLNLRDASDFLRTKRQSL